MKPSRWQEWEDTEQAKVSNRQATKRRRKRGWERSQGQEKIGRRTNRIQDQVRNKLGHQWESDTRSTQDAGKAEDQLVKYVSSCHHHYEGQRAPRSTIHSACQCTSVHHKWTGVGREWKCTILSGLHTFLRRRRAWPCRGLAGVADLWSNLLQLVPWHRFTGIPLL